MRLIGDVLSVEIGYVGLRVSIGSLVSERDGGTGISHGIMDGYVFEITQHLHIRLRILYIMTGLMYLILERFFCLTKDIFRISYLIHHVISEMRIYPQLHPSFLLCKG